MCLRQYINRAQWSRTLGLAQSVSFPICSSFPQIIKIAKHGKLSCTEVTQLADSRQYVIHEVIFTGRDTAV